MNPTTRPRKDRIMTPERLLEHADAVRAAHTRERGRARRKLARLDLLVESGKHDHLKPLRAKIAAAAGVERWWPAPDRAA